MTEEEKAHDIITRLCKAGPEAYIAGGAARDILNGEVPSDYDVVTNAPYEQVLELFRDRKVSVVGISFKVCIVDGIEVSTYRRGGGFGQEDQDIAAERAETIYEDLARRDLTINAMAFCPYNGDVVDPFGGREDLKRRMIRFTGNPKDRISEDPCRIIRACRFKAKLKGTFDPATLNAMKTLSHTVGQVAPERLRLELLKAMGCETPSLFFNALHETGALGYVSPGLEACYGHEGGDYHGETIDQHVAIVGDALSGKKPLLRLAGYFHDMGKPPSTEYHDGKLSFISHEKTGAHMVSEELKTLKFSLKETDYVTALVRHHMRRIEEEDKPKTVRRVLRKLKDDDVNWKDWLRLIIADAKGNLKKEDFSREQIRGIVMKIYHELHPASGKSALTVFDLAINGNDVMAILKHREGPEIGRVLNKALDYVLDDPETNTRERLLEFVKGLFDFERDIE
jgi:putative nucleotidyltransferase with HDIG domain